MCSCPLVGKGSGLGLRSSFITAPQPAAGSDAPMILRCYGRICTSSQCGIASVPVGSRIAWSCSARPVVMRGSSTAAGPCVVCATLQPNAHASGIKRRLAESAIAKFENVMETDFAKRAAKRGGHTDTK
jgi:hypothetical protein